jgi:hypothetical protein
MEKAVREVIEDLAILPNKPLFLKKEILEII